EPNLMCLTGMQFDADKMAVQVKALTTVKFPYAVKYKDTLDTPVDDPTDMTGAVPPAPTTPACDATSLPLLDDLLTCLEASCARTPGAPSSPISDDPITCTSKNCGKPLTTMVASAPECWMCAFGQIAGYVSFADTRTACTTDPRARLAYGGTSDVMLLSRIAIKN